MDGTQTSTKRMQEAASEPHLVDELVEGVLAVGARLAKVDLACHRGEEGNTLQRGIGRGRCCKGTVRLPRPLQHTAAP